MTSDAPLLTVWLASAHRDAITARLQAIADAVVRDESRGVMGGVAHAPVVEVYAAKREGRREHVCFLFDYQLYHHAQSGSDWDTHSVVLGEATFEGSDLVAHTLKNAKEVTVQESQGSTGWYRRDGALREVRDAARAQLIDDGTDGP